MRCYHWARSRKFHSINWNRPRDLIIRLVPFHYLIFLLRSNVIDYARLILNSNFSFATHKYIHHAHELLAFARYTQARTLFDISFSQIHCFAFGCFFEIAFFHQSYNFMGILFDFGISNVMLADKSLENTNRSPKQYIVFE